MFVCVCVGGGAIYLCTVNTAVWLPDPVSEFAVPPPGRAGAAGGTGCGLTVWPQSLTGHAARDAPAAAPALTPQQPAALQVTPQDDRLI